MSLLSSQFNSNVYVSVKLSIQSHVYVCVSDYFQTSKTLSTSTFDSIQINANPLSICFWANNNGHVYLQIKSMSNQTSNLYLAICLVIGQVASSIQRTACTCLYAHVSVKRQVRSKEQFVPCLYFVIGQTTSSIQRTVCTYLHVVIVIKQQVRSKEQLVSSYMSMSPVK
jgi:hypothetical protein